MQAKQKRIIEDAIKHCQSLVDGRLDVPSTPTSKTLSALKDAIEAARAEQESDPNLRELVASTRKREHASASAERAAKENLANAQRKLIEAQSVYDGMSRFILKAHEPAQHYYTQAHADLKKAQVAYIDAEHAFREQVPTKMEYIAVLSRPLDLSSENTPPSLRMAQRFDKVRKWPRLRMLWQRLNHLASFSIHQALAHAFTQRSLAVGEKTLIERQAKQALRESELVRDTALAFQPIANAQAAVSVAAGEQYQAQQALAAALSEQATSSREDQAAKTNAHQRLWQKPAFVGLVSAWMAYQLERTGKRNTSATRVIPAQQATSSDGFYADPTWILLSQDLSQDSGGSGNWAGGGGHSGGGGASGSWDHSPASISSHDSSSHSSSSDSGSDGGGGGGGD